MRLTGLQHVECTDSVIMLIKLQWHYAYRLQTIYDSCPSSALQHVNYSPGYPQFSYHTA